MAGFRECLLFIISKPMENLWFLKELRKIPLLKRPDVSSLPSERKRQYSLPFAGRNIPMEK